jgi:hypothetical protein
MKFTTEKDGQDDFEVKILFIFGKSKCQIFRRITFSANYYLPFLYETIDDCEGSENIFYPLLNIVLLGKEYDIS